MFLERKACPACDRSKVETIWRTSLTEGALGTYLRGYYRQEPPVGDYWLVRCVKCGLIYQKLIGDEAFLTSLYSDWITAIDDPWTDASYRADMEDWQGSRDAHELTTAMAYLGKSELKVLDYGTGWGLWPTIAARLGCDAYATELAPKKAAYVARHDVKVIDEAEISRHDFDFINFEQVLEHVPEPFALLRKANARIVKVAVPDASRTNAIGVKSLRGITPVQPFEHINGFTRESLNTLANRAGLKPIRSTIPQRYGFLRNGIPRGPKRIVKELIRPLYRPPIYAWFARQ